MNILGHATRKKNYSVLKDAALQHNPKEPCQKRKVRKSNHKVRKSISMAMASYPVLHGDTFPFKNLVHSLGVLNICTQCCSWVSNSPILWTLRVPPVLAVEK